MHILIADDTFEVREALKCILQDECDLQLSSEASSANELLAQLAVTCPDLILLDWELPGLSRRTLVQRIHELCPAIRVIAMSAHPEACEDAQAAGVGQFVSKGEPPERLVSAVRQPPLG